MFAMLKQAWNRKDLLAYLVATRLKQNNSDYLLGYLWWFVEPLLMMVVYWVFVGVILGRAENNYPYFILCGLIPFRGLAMTLGHSTASVIQGYHLLSQMNFPRMYLPLVTVLENQIKLFFGYLVIVPLSGVWGAGVSPNLLLLVFPFMLQLVLCTGMSLMFSVVGVYVRDLVMLIQFITRLLIFLSPVLYSLERIPEQYQGLYMLNPLSVIIVQGRSILMGGPGVDAVHLLAAWGVSLAILLAGAALFADREYKMMKVL